MKSTLRIFLIISIIALVNMGFLVFFFFQVGKDTEKQNQKRFTEAIDNFTFSLKQIFEREKSVMQGLQGLFVASEFVSYREWNNYFESLNFDQTFPGTEWISFVKNLPPQDVTSYLEKHRKGSDTAIKIWPETNLNTRHSAIIYISPRRFENLRGYDFNQNENQRQALEQSAKSDQIVSGNALVFNPVKKKKSQIMLALAFKKFSETSVNPYGWIVTQIDLAVMINNILNGEFQDSFHLNVYQGTHLSNENLVYQFGTADIQQSAYSKKVNINFAGNEWTFFFQATPVFLKASGTYVFTYVIMALFYVALGFALYYYFALRKFKVSDRTFFEHAIFKSTCFGHIIFDMTGKIVSFNPAMEKITGYTQDEVLNKMQVSNLFLQTEMEERARELSTQQQKEVKSGFEVLASISCKQTPETRNWIIVKKDQSQIPVRLVICAIKNLSNEMIGYSCAIFDTATFG